jgi:DNA-binding IclR family transcriptional regulator
LLAIIDAGRAGATREELAEQTGIRLASICGRVNELLRVGLVQEDGRTRLNESAREAAVVTAMKVR